MSIKCTPLIAALLICISAPAQNYFYNDQYYDSDILYEIGMNAGGINCLTDLGGRKGPGKGFLKDLNISNTKLTGGIYAGILYRSAIGLRAEFNMGSITASDAVLKNDMSAGKHRYLRNLHFRTTIMEFSLAGEVYPAQLLFPVAEDERTPRLTPYVTAGVGLFRFNPQTNVNGIWVDLRPLRTEGQGFTEHADRKPYALTQVNFPVGMGIRYEATAFLNLRLEVLHRITRTDYLDDVSTTYIDPALFDRYLPAADASLAKMLHNRSPPGGYGAGSIRGNSSKNDSYFTFVLKVGLLLGRERR